MKKPTTVWLDRSIVTCQHYTLCISDAQFRNALKELRVSGFDDPWLDDHSLACTHRILMPNGCSMGSLVCIVCIDSTRVKNGRIEIYSLLVHEAVHVWQTWCDEVGERQPGREQEAYSIQNISWALMARFDELQAEAATTITGTLKMEVTK